MAQPMQLHPIVSRLKALLPLAAATFFALSLAYLVAFAVRNWSAIRSVASPEPGPVAIAAAVYLLAHPATAANWVLGVRALGQNVSFADGFKIAFASQVAKYLPGNVAHYFARTGLAKAAGVTLVSSSVATLVEILTALLAAAAIVATATLVDPAPLAVLDAALTRSRAVPASIGLIAICAIALTVYLTSMPARTVLRMLACHAVNFMLVALSFFAVTASLTDQALAPGPAIGIFTAAWVAGYLVPGAPAGLGVREAVLVAWLSPIIGPGEAIACTVFHRLLTASCDALVGIAGYGWLRAGRSAYAATEEVRS